MRNYCWGNIKRWKGKVSKKASLCKSCIAIRESCKGHCGCTMPKILAVCTTQLIALSSTKLDQKSRSRQHECRTTGTEECDWGGSAWRKINARGMRLDTNASGTYKTSFEFGGMRPGKPLSNRIDPCQRSWWRSTRKKNPSQTFGCATYSDTRHVKDFLLIWRCLPVAISVITATKHIY